jgi:GT2 family glycosyltransferase/glycosyltransferase involved in cell wall biosynthesis
VSGTLRLAVLSLDQPESACARLRLLDPLGCAGSAVRVAWHAGPAAARAALESGALAAADLVVVQRFFPHPANATVLERVLGGPVPVVYETDDLLTDLPPTNPHAALARECAPWIERVARAARAVTVSTPELARAFEGLSRDVHVLPNTVDLRLFPFRARDGAPLVVGYSATPTHADDLARIEPALWRLSERFGSRVRFWFQGCITPGLTRLPGAIQVGLQTDYSAYARLLAGSPLDLALAPLADHRFNRAKSAIKWLEYSACGIAGVFADLPPYRSAIRAGETGGLAGADPDAWYEAIRELIEDRQRRLRIAAAARRAVEAEHTLLHGSRRLLETLRSLAVPRSAAATPRARVSIVIPVYGRLDLTRGCLAELLEHTQSPEVEVIVVDNASPDETGAYLASLGARIRVISNDSNLGFARACNQGARAARGDRLLFLNNDTLPPRGWLEPLEAELERDPRVAIVGARLLYPDGSVQHAGVAFSRPDCVPYHVYRGAPRRHPAVSRRRELGAVTAACMLVRRQAFEAAGGFDEGYHNGFEDIDLCLRVRAAGGRVIYQPQSELIHLEEQTPGRKAHDGPNLQRFLSRWQGRIAPDETRMLLADGCAVVEVSGARRIEELTSDAQRRAWQRVADAEARLEREGPDGLRAHPLDLSGWPDDPGVRGWGRQLGGREIAPPGGREIAPLGGHMASPVAAPGLRLLLVSHAYPGETSGGAELYARSLARALSRRGNRVTVLFPRLVSGARAARLEPGRDGDVQLARLAVPAPSGVISDVRNEPVERAFCELLDAGRFDAVHFQHTWRALPFALIEHAARRAPVCATLHDFWSVCRETHMVPRWQAALCSGPETPGKCAQCDARAGGGVSAADPALPQATLFALRANAARRALARADLISAPSRYLIERLRASGLDLPMLLAPLGLEPFDAPLRAPSPTLRLGFLGALCATKGIAPLLAAFQAVRGDASLVIRGPADRAGEQLVAQVHDPRIRRLGPYRREEIGSVLAELDAVVIPSLVETYSLVAREALAAGRIVISSDAGALPEVVLHERNGLVFPAGDARALTRALQRLVDDRALLERLCGARTAVPGIDEDAAAWEQRYRELCERRTRTPRRTAVHSSASPGVQA